MQDKFARPFVKRQGVARAGLATTAARLVPLTLATVMLLVAGAAVAATAPVEISSMEVRDLAPGAELRVEADGPLVWTQYRDDTGNLVVELPNTVVRQGVDDLSDPIGLLESVNVESQVDGERPLTRLVIQTIGDTEHSLFVDDQLLTLQFQQVLGSVVAGADAPAPQLAPEPFYENDGQPEPIAEVAAAAPFETAPLETESSSPRLEPIPVSTSESSSVGTTIEPAALEPMGQTPAGTADNPTRGPAPDGVVATQLVRVEVLEIDGETALKIVGDGQFAYSLFQLEDPSRFVIDLEGVVNTTESSSLTVDSRWVRQVRMAQFSPFPEPVSRVVLDLSGGENPTVEPAADGLLVRIGAGAMASAQVAQAPVDSAAPADEAETVLEPITDDSSAAEEMTTEVAGFDEPEQETEPMETGAPGEIPIEQATRIGAPPQAPPTATPSAEPVSVASVPIESVESEPLRIQTASQERPSQQIESASDVSLFEAQQVVIDSSQQQSEIPAATFGVQALDPTNAWMGEPISMSLKDADVTEVLRTIARLSGLNLVIQPGVQGPVTVELDAVPWDQALDQILKVNGLGMQLEGTVLRIAPINQLQQEAVAQQALDRARALSVPLKTVLKRVSYANANEIARILTRGLRSGGGSGGGGVSGFGFFDDSGILSQRGSVAVDQRTNTLIIQELPDYLDTVIQVIENLDVPTKQVMIEGRIIETTRNFSRSLGVNWSFDGIASAATGNTTGLEFPNNIDANGGVTLLRGGQNGFLNVGLGNILNTFQLDMALTAAESEGLVNVISAPKVATLDNEQAEIQTGLQIPIQTVANNTVSVQFVNATLRLRVTPQVTAEGTIVMDIEIQKREPQLAFAVIGATNAPIATREARTTVIVRDGGTAVIGGIYEVSSNDGSDRVPGLANIPILGHLFKNRARENQNEELLIFITPRVIQL